MNNVILFMWLGDIAGNIQSVLGTAVIAVGIFSAVVIIGCFIHAHDHLPSGEEGAFMLRALKRLSLLLLFVIPSLILLILAPSRDTMRLGAALSAGKVVIDSPIGQKAGEAANAILDRIINEAKPKDTK